MSAVLQPRLRSLRLQGAGPATGESYDQLVEHLRRGCRQSRLADVTAVAPHLLALSLPGSAGRSLERELASLQPVAPEPPRESQLWLMRRLDGSLVGMLRLRADGSVGPQPNPNEARWTMRNGELLLGTAEGRVMTRFTVGGTADGRRVHVGLFADDRTVHVLSEVGCRYSQLRLLDPELVAPFAGTFRPEQMADTPLPARPAVLLAAPRTGSHLLLNLLNSSARVFFDAELLNSAHISVFAGDIAHDQAGALYTLRANDPLQFLRVMLSRSHHVDGRMLDDVAVRGFKLFPQQSHRALDWVLQEPAFRIVHLHRANLLAEFSSSIAAYATGEWVAGDRRSGPRRYPFQSGRFLAFVEMKRRYLGQLRDRLAARGADVCEIEYSAIDRHSVNGALSHLLGEACDLSTNALGLKQQLSGPVIDRFTNPDDVMRCLAAIGHEEWAGVEKPEVQAA